TVRELVMVLLVQLLTVSGLGCIAGLLVGAALLEPAGVVILITLGLSWNRPVSMATAAGVFAGVCIVITALTLFIGREYSKTPVLQALHGIRGGERSGRSCFPFEHTPLPISLTIALKETFGKFGSKIGIIFIMAVLSVSTVIGLGLVDTFGRDDESLLRMSGLFESDAAVDGSETMLNNIAGMSTVKTVYGDTWYAFNYSKGKRVSSITTRAFTDASLIRGGNVIEGHWPENEKEIMLATAAADNLGAGMGDRVIIKNSGKEETYRVCGLCQTLNNMGMMAYITVTGYERVAPLPDEYGLWIDLKRGCTFDQFKEEFKDAYPDVEVTDYMENVAGTLGVVSGGMKAVALLISVLTVLIVAFVVSLVVRAQITREWRNLGVRKALGFTSGQLIRETMLSNIPAIAIGVVTGLAVSTVSGKKLMGMVYSIFGFRRVEFDVLPVSYVLTALLICGIAMATAALLGRRIKTLEPVNMITEE
ncbi:MAG: ABC transporter permease, partial [Lachnospiraceae bacterium]|nr:ABC transporter permease [Lachnospiraceae bacterium]